jgi:hypothetical protein
MRRITALTALAAVLCFGALSVQAQQKADRGSKDEQEACTPDVYKHCNDAIPDEKRIVACLKANKKKLSPACRKVFFDD